MNMKVNPTEKRRCLWKDMLFGFVLLMAVGLVLLFTMMHMGKKKLLHPADYAVPTESTDPEAYKEIHRDGIHYTYKEDLVNILILGIDGEDKAVENTVYGAGPKSDAIYLATFDVKEKKLTFLSISRDTITGIHYTDSFGKDIGIFDGHLTLQYANGDGLHWSCELTSEAVSRLLDGIPVHAYTALYWNSIKPLTDAIGPVPVIVPEYMCWVNPPVFHYSGYMELDGRQAVEFVRERDINIPGSNEVRSVHQQEFLQSFFDVTKQKLKKNPLIVLELKKIIDDYLVTDLALDEMVTLASWVGGWDIQTLDIRSLPGESVEGDLHDEFYVDEQGKQELLLELFYQKQQ
ncbi:MAG: LCP family protein [Lachnospiraceae bacterium]|nr:LCP family protein [Lachnospiraceae bacterium]